MLYLVALRAVGRRVCCFVSAAPVRVGVSCRRRLFGALFVCSRSCVVGPRSWTGSPSWSVLFGFLLLFALLPLLRLFITHIRTTPPWLR